MAQQFLENWLPPIKNTENGPRRIGIEIEMAGVSAKTMINSITSLYGGDVREVTPVEHLVENSSLGAFKIELDASYLKALAEKQGRKDTKQDSLTSAAIEFITWAAEQAVPWEVVAPPVEIAELSQLENLVSELRKSGALGTRHALHYAFGVHLNPELPNLDVQTILNYMRAYFCLYDWISLQEKIDTTRRLTSYIKHFDRKYINKVIDLNYAPSLSELIQGYLKYNPTRNRSLDLLPLFSHLDSNQVKSVIDDPRIKSRPCFHYRLPNCDIDNSNWNISFPWHLWLEVEKLAGDPKKLAIFCEEYQKSLERITHTMDSHWVRRVAELLNKE